MKSKLLTNIINKKDLILKKKYHTNYKKYRILLSTLIKKSNQAYYETYFGGEFGNKEQLKIVNKGQLKKKVNKRQLKMVNANY